MKRIPDDELDDAKALCEDLGVSFAEFTFVLTEQIPAAPGPVIRTIEACRADRRVKFDGATWVTDFAGALKGGMFG